MGETEQSKHDPGFCWSGIIRVYSTKYHMFGRACSNHESRLKIADLTTWELPGKPLVPRNQTASQNRDQGWLWAILPSY